MIKNDRKNYSSKAIRKWHIAILLIQNPSLVFLRKNALLQIKNKEMQSLNENKRTQSCFRN
jgi:hypothetical protein